MSKIVLRKCDIRFDSVVGVKEEDPKDYSWEEYSQLFASVRSSKDLLMLRSVKPGMYVGRIKRDGVSRLFLLGPLVGSKSVSWLTAKNPEFWTGLELIYEVHSVYWDCSVEEASKETA